MKAEYKLLNPFPVYVGFVPTEEVWNKEIKRLGAKSDFPKTDGAATYLTDEQGRLTVLVTISPLAYEEEFISKAPLLLIHEAVHVFQELCEHIGEEKPSREFEAYYIEGISEFLIEAYNKCLAKKLN